MTEPTFLAGVSNVVLIATADVAPDWLAGWFRALIGWDSLTGRWLCSHLAVACPQVQTGPHLSPSEDPWVPKCELVWGERTQVPSPATTREPLPQQLGGSGRVALSLGQTRRTK